VRCRLGGGREIRTPEGSPPSGFQDRRNRPLCHPSGAQYSIGGARRPDRDLLLLVSTGARIGEVLALSWEDIDLDVGTVTFRRSASNPWHVGYAGTGVFRPSIVASTQNHKGDFGRNCSP
jgi:hypothetical protein